MVEILRDADMAIFLRDTRYYVENKPKSKNKLKNVVKELYTENLKTVITFRATYRRHWYNGTLINAVSKETFFLKLIVD